MKRMRKQVLGVTLIEILLVTVIISAILYMVMGYIQQKTLQARFDKAAAQMQQILNAALAYYTANNSTWPSSLACLQGLGGAGCTVAYLPNPIMNPFWPGNSYFVFGGNPTQFVLYTPVIATAPKSYGYATVLAGMLPMAYTTDGSGMPGTCSPATAMCFVITTVPPPGQNLNNATAVNFAGLYHNGACVPVPVCPVAANGTPLVASILTVPASVTGAYNAPTGATCSPTNLSGCSVDSFPINSFTASATGPVTASATDGPPSCATGVNAPCYESYDASGNPGSTLIGRQYWRVCLSVLTEHGAVNPNSGSSATNNAWGQLSGNVMAITRCVISGEENGSGFTVWSR